MSAIHPKSIRDVDLTPIPGKRYWSSDREWREEFIYFLMVDRFHDGRPRAAAAAGARPPAYPPERLRRFCGGTLKGIASKLDYIQGLGCTAVWLSPIFENDGAPDPSWGSYHGYAIRNYLAIDPRFGTKQDLIDLVDKAHDRGMRVFLDAVANHCGDVWYYPGDQPYYYSEDHRQYPIGGWRSPDYPVPVELRNPDYFHRRGQIRDCGWDNLPETQWGDFFSLKGFNNEDDPAGLELQRLIIDCHRYWMREADIDGYRMDAVKHMGEAAIARFCQAMREYAYQLGKRNFLLFGELVGGDDAINRYTGPNTAGKLGNKTVFYGLSSVLDFPLYWTLPGVIKGFENPAKLVDRHEALRARALSRGELGRYLVTFIDNHDQIGQNRKRRFAAGAHQRQVVAALGYLICALGTPCVYYGTEQGYCGEGDGDEFIREPMFDLDDPARDFLDPDNPIYQAVAAIAKVNREHPALRFGRMYFRDISGNGYDFGPPCAQPCTLAFSRILADQEVLVAYNTSTDQTRRDWVIVDSGLHKAGDKLRFIYGKEGEVTVRAHPDPANGSLAVQLELKPMEFVILT
ncbi:MAG: alpha-amylase family glycosyl hydrolase [Candidatus Edwardsbacteria bacterium]|jgi:alpha-amylase|nr:alpha-amylase family glycosyl hydrolase [Candidatus Edwardsbacteria bacterium]